MRMWLTTRDGSPYVVAYSCGRCSSNGRAGVPNSEPPIAWSTAYFGRNHPLNAGALAIPVPGDQTSQRAQLNAAIHALRLARLNCSLSLVVLRTNSEYVQQCFRQRRTWEAEGFFKSGTKQPLDNVDLVKELLYEGDHFVEVRVHLVTEEMDQTFYFMHRASLRGPERKPTVTAPAPNAVPTVPDGKKEKTAVTSTGTTTTTTTTTATKTTTTTPSSNRKTGDGQSHQQQKQSQSSSTTETAANKSASKTVDRGKGTEAQQIQQQDKNNKPAAGADLKSACA